LESYIAGQIDDGDISWFPTDKALILQDYGTSDDTNTGVESLRKIQEDQQNLIKEVTMLSKNIHNMDDLVKKYEIKKFNASSKQPTIRSFSSGAVNIFEGQAPVSKILGSERKGQNVSPGRSSMIKSNVNISDMEDEDDNADNDF